MASCHSSELNVSIGFIVDSLSRVLSHVVRGSIGGLFDNGLNSPPKRKRLRVFCKQGVARNAPWPGSGPRKFPVRNHAVVISPVAPNFRDPAPHHILLGLGITFKRRVRARKEGVILQSYFDITRIPRPRYDCVNFESPICVPSFFLGPRFIHDDKPARRRFLREEFLRVCDKPNNILPNHTPFRLGCVPPPEPDGRDTPARGNCRGSFVVEKAPFVCKSRKWHHRQNDTCDKQFDFRQHNSAPHEIYLCGSPRRSARKINAAI